MLAFLDVKSGSNVVKIGHVLSNGRSPCRLFEHAGIYSNGMNSQLPKLIADPLSKFDVNGIDVLNISPIPETSHKKFVLLEDLQSKSSKNGYSLLSDLSVSTPQMPEMVAKSILGTEVPSFCKTEMAKGNLLEECTLEIPKISEQKVISLNEKKINLARNVIRNCGIDIAEVILKRFNEYFEQIKDITGREVTDEQKHYLINFASNNEIVKLKPDEKEKSRRNFNKNKKDIIESWEKNTGQTWPKYDRNILVNRKIARYKGQNYDAHHIIELSWGGPNKWQNIHPAAFPNEHQDGIHADDGVAASIFGPIKPEFHNYPSEEKNCFYSHNVIKKIGFDVQGKSSGIQASFADGFETMKIDDERTENAQNILVKRSKNHKKYHRKNKRKGMRGKCKNFLKARGLVEK